MRALSDLRVILPYHDADKPLQELINDVLRSKRFQLRTLYINEFLDVAGIVDNQPQLQILALYYRGKSSLETMRCLETPDALSTRLLIFALDVLPYFNTVRIFPTYYSDPSAICRTIAFSFNQDLADSTLTRRERVTTVYIYLRDLSDMVYTRKIMEDVALHFPQVNILHLLVEHPRLELNCPEFTNILALFPNLGGLNFCLWSGKNLEDTLGVPRMMALANEWMQVCLHLRRIRLERANLDWDDESSVWKVAIW